MDAADVIWLETNQPDLAALAHGLQGLAEDLDIGVWVHRQGFAATVVHVHSADPMAGPFLAQGCAPAIAKALGCRAWYLSALAGSADYLSVEAIDQKGQTRWSAFSDDKLSAKTMRPLAERLGLALDDELHYLNYAYWRMVEDASIPVAKHLAIAVKPVLQLESAGWRQLDFDAQLHPNRRAKQEGAWQQWKDTGDRQAHGLCATLEQLKKKLGQQTPYAVAVNSNGTVAANTIEALEQGLAQWKKAEPWTAKGGLSEVLLRWAPALWPFQVCGPSTDSVHTEVKARLCAEVFGKVTALYWDRRIEPLPKSLPDHQVPGENPREVFRAALHKLDEATLLAAAERVFCGPPSKLCKLLDPSDLEQIVTEEMRRRVPRIVPAALERAAHLGRRGKRLLSPIDPETLGWLYQRQRRALARQPSLLARLRRALGQRGA